MAVGDYSTTRDDNASIIPGNIRSGDYVRDQQIINSIRQLMADLAVYAAAGGSPIIATQAEAEAGTNNTRMMTPLRTAQAIDVQAVRIEDVGVTVQAFDAGLLSIAGLTTVADRLPYTTASDTYAVTTFTAFARTVLDDADDTTMRATIGADNATNIIAGTLADARLPSSMANKQFTGTTIIDGVTSTAAAALFRNVTNANTAIFGGTSGDGANLEVYGSTHATVPNQAFVDANTTTFRNANGSGTPTVKIGADTIAAGAFASLPLSIANGGTASATASAARTALGLAIGTDVQAFDAGLLSIAGLTTSADKMIYATASDVYATTTLTSFARTLLDDADAQSARLTLETTVVVATIVALKALDTTKDTIALLKKTDGRRGIFIWTTGNFSTQITTDTFDGVYVKANAIASTAGAWVRVHNGIFYPEWFGALGDNTQNDGPNFVVALAVIDLDRGGVLKLEAKEYLISATTLNMPDGVRIEGVYGNLESLGSVLRLASGSKIDMGGSQGADLAYLRIQSDSTTVPAIDFDDESNTASYPTLNRLMVVGGRETIRFNNVLEARVTQCRFLTIAGSTRVIYFDGTNGGVGSNNGIDAVEFVQCTFGSPSEATANCLDLNGDAASIKFTNCVVLFGNKGMVGRRVGGGTTSDPRFVYFVGGGFENNAGPCVEFVNGSMIKFANFYASTDAIAGVSGDCLRLGSGGDFIITGGEIRGGARDGIRVFADSNATITGCHIGNNGRAEAGDGVTLSTAGKVVLVGNNIGAFSDGSNGQLYAVRLTTMSVAVDIVGNQLSDNVTGAIVGTIPAGSRVEGNVGGLTGSATYNPASLADGAGVTTTVTVTGAALGMYAVASFSLDLQGITFTSWVSAANTVSVRFQNETGGTIDLASGTISANARPLL